MLILITVEYLRSHKSQQCKISRVPCVGEILTNEYDDQYEVVMVMHHMFTQPQPENEPVAIVRVK